MNEETLLQRDPRGYRLLAVTCGLLLLGLWLRWPALVYSGTLAHELQGSDLPPQQVFNDFAFAHFSYTDILSLYFRDNLAAQPLPYVDYSLEYPPGIGIFSYLLSLSGDPQAYYLLTYLILSLCTLGTVMLLRREPGSRPWVFALAPAIAIHVGINWDMLAVLPLIAALILARRDRMLAAGLLLALATWIKVFPIFFLFPLLATLAIERRWRAAALLLAGFGAASLAINLPVMLVNFEGWRVFLAYQIDRVPEVNLWRVFPQLEPRLIGQIVLLLTILGIVVTSLALLPARLTSRMRRAQFAGGALLLWIFFTSKVYSPQYSLWVLALLALVGLPAALTVAFWAIDLIYFLFSFTTLALLPYEQAVGWFYDYQLFPSMLVREALLLLLTLWALRRAWLDAQREVVYAGAT